MGSKRSLSDALLLRALRALVSQAPLALKALLEVYSIPYQ